SNATTGSTAGGPTLRRRSRLRSPPASGPPWPPPGRTGVPHLHPLFVRNAESVRRGGPAADGGDVDGHDRTGRGSGPVLGVLGTEHGDRRTVLGPLDEDPRCTVEADPPQLRPVVLVVVDEQAHRRVDGDVLQPAQRRRPLGFVVDHGVGDVAVDGEAARHEMRPPVGVHGRQPGHRRGRGQLLEGRRYAHPPMVALETPPFRADHVGSLLRPPGLLQAREAHAAGRLSDDELRAAEDAAIGEVVAMQDGVGLRAATDGEFRRASWHMDFIYQLGGISRAEQNLTVRFRNEAGTLEFTPAALRVDGPVRLDHVIFAEPFRFLAGAVTTAVPKLTIPSPSMVHYRGGRAAVDPSVYPDLDAFWDDLSAAYAAEVRGLAELGCTYLQLDDTSLAYLNDPEQRELVASMGGDPDRQHVRYIRQ